MSHGLVAATSGPRAVEPDLESRAWAAGCLRRRLCGVGCWSVKEGCWVIPLVIITARGQESISRSLVLGLTHPWLISR